MPFSKTFNVSKANLYVGEREQEKIVRVMIFDILFNDQICSLLYMQDLTPSSKAQQLEYFIRKAQATQSEALKKTQAIAVELFSSCTAEQR